jgi:hypothetical protein
MATQPFTNLDFANVKDNLKNYLKGQDQFKDYDFEGSNMNVLLDILAYNTFQNNFYTNMAISEMFLDSAQLRDSLASHAKELNYTPRSVRSSQAAVDIEFFPNDNPSSIVIPARANFIARCGTRNFNFTNPVPHVIRPVNGRYLGSGIDVYEGEYVEEFFRVDGTSEQRFIVSNDDVDTTSLRVFISENEQSTSEIEYRLKTSVYDIESDDTVFFIQPYTGNKYEIIFGQNVIGSNPTNGNVIRIIYRRASGAEANGINDISLLDSINGYGSNLSLVSTSQGGADRESIESIRFFAPKTIQIQERAITENDYAVLLQRQFPELSSVSVYGGEELSPPQYGRVVVSVYNNNTENLSESKRTQYASYLNERSPITVDPIIIPARFMYVDITSNIYYNINATNASSAAINTVAKRAIQLYNLNNLDRFKANLRYSKLTSAIDNSEVSILSNDTTVRATITISPEINEPRFFVLQYANRLLPDKIVESSLLGDFKPAIESSAFTYSGQTVFLQDNGSGRLDIVKVTNDTLTYVQRNVGTVNYATGDVTIRPIIIQDYDGNGINVYARLYNKDIIAPKDRILKIRDEDIKLNVFGRRQ